MNAPLKGENRPQSAPATTERLAELERQLAHKQLSQKLFEAGDGHLAGKPYELIYAALVRAEGMAKLLADVFADMDGQHVYVSPMSVGYTAEALERQIRAAIVHLDDYQEKGGFGHAVAGEDRP